MPYARTAVTALLTLAAPALADTTMTAAHVYEIDAAVDFAIANSGSSSFLFTWTDASGTFTDVEDPTLILSAGQTYTFRRTTGSHPFSITDNTLVVTGTDGSYARTTTDIAVMDAATLQPMADFIADPAPTADMITWALTGADVGDYYYTCRVTFHTGMTGRIQVVAAPCNPADLDASGALNLDDVNLFAGAFVSGDLLADIDASGTLNLDDVNLFAQAFIAGCP
ncbi:MAG: GC-type dockerin domain-anchored protein [Phycisphaerales bacterium]